MTVAKPISTSPHPTVAGTITSARDLLEGEEYIPVAACVDILLDCLNAAVRPNVKSAVERVLPDFTIGNIRRSEEFGAALDQIQVALQVDAAFDEVVEVDEVEEPTG